MNEQPKIDLNKQTMAEVRKLVGKIASTALEKGGKP